MIRPLIVTDCDEVLLHMVSHFRDWLGEVHEVDFDLGNGSFTEALRYRGTGAVVETEAIWALLGGFFDTEMERQTLVPGADRAIDRLSPPADIVVLTNLGDARREARMAQLAAHGIDLPVYTNQGPKGPALLQILEERQPSQAIFIDDLPQHHDSVAQVAPHVGRLHFCAEPAVASRIECAHEAGHAHARIDNWPDATDWLLARLGVEQEENAQ